MTKSAKGFPLMFGTIVPVWVRLCAVLLVGLTAPLVARAQTGASAPNDGFLMHGVKHCTQFHTGKFRYDKASLQHMVVTRTDEQQVEYDPITKTRVEMAIQWKSDCAYTLTVTKIKGSSSGLKLGDKVEVEILGILGSQLTLHMEHQGKKTDYVMHKVEN